MKNFNGFTLAEVLITLAIIGVVAALTLPTLIQKINNREYDRAREKALMSIGEAGRLLAVQGDIGAGTDAEDFIKNYLSKKLKIVKTCDSNNLEKCGLSPTIKKLDGTTTMNMPTTIAELGLPSISNSTWKNNTTNYGFVTANGYSVNIFYNPQCTTDTNNDNLLASGYVCFNAIYDMNGLRNPNQVGKDIGFVTVLYPNETNRAVAPNPVAVTDNFSMSWGEANVFCESNNLSSHYRKGIVNPKDKYTLPDKDELLSMAINGNLINANPSGYYWSSSVYSANSSYAWIQYFGSGTRLWYYETYSASVRCVRR